jgi:hypothetical protein
VSLVDIPSTMHAVVAMLQLLLLGAVILSCSSSSVVNSAFAGYMATMSNGRSGQCGQCCVGFALALLQCLSGLNLTTLATAG